MTLQAQNNMLSSPHLGGGELCMAGLDKPLKTALLY